MAASADGSKFEHCQIHLWRFLFLLPGVLAITVASSYAETVGEVVALRKAVLIPVSAPLGYLHESTQDALARLSP